MGNFSEPPCCFEHRQVVSLNRPHPITGCFGVHFPLAVRSEPRGYAEAKRIARSAKSLKYWLGRQDSNLGMAESKSSYFLLFINGHSEKIGNAGFNVAKRLAAISE
jgi:hypothetical protein